MTSPAFEAEVGPALTGSPDWYYLVREFDLAYRLGSAGGSPAIRTHMKQVRDRLAKIVGGAMEISLPQPQRKPVHAHLERALDNGLDGAMRSMVKSVDNVKDQLSWEYGYEKMPRYLASRYAYADIVGPKGPILCGNLTLGLVLFAPRTTYPAHSHDGITESYLTLSGHWSENDAAVYAPGSMVLNLPQHTHTITTADREPVLLAYAWCGDNERLTTPTMKFSRKSNRLVSGGGKRAATG